MKSLIFLWEISLVLCGIALVALLVLVAARVVALRGEKRRADLRAQLLPALLAGEGLGDALTGVPLDVATRLTGELAEMTRGTDREAMLARATVLGVPGLLTRRLHSRSAQVRLAAVETLAMFEQCAGETAAALDDANPDVRLGAALALAQRGEAPPPAVLVEKLKMGSEENSLLLVSLMSDLAKRDPGAVAALLFERDVPVAAKVVATDALAETGGEFTPLLAYMAQQAAGEPELQPRIYRALGRNGHPAGAAAIVSGLDSEEWFVRSSAAEAAGKAGILAAADRLGALLEDENWWVRYRAGEALLRMGARGLAVLRAQGATGSETARNTATALLAEGRAA